MKVILSKNVEGLGEKDELVNVRAGYGRHYLFPNQLAVIANEGNKKDWAERTKQSQAKRAQLLDEAKALAAKLATEKIEVYTKINESGSVFGSITALQISKALKDKGFDVDKNAVIIDKIIKKEGEHSISLRLSKEVQLPLTLLVLPEKE